MNADFWFERWRQGRIGFHEGRTNVLLERHAARLGPRRRVLVPLCGKTEDMAHLASLGHEVVGIELVPEAIAAFFREHGLSPEVRDQGRMRRWSAERIVVLEGDLFASTKDDVGPVDALYDRAAIVALPPDVRQRYATHVRGLLPAEARALFITFDYPQERFTGPPFSVPLEELRRLFPGARFEELEQLPLRGPRFEEAGLVGAERCTLVELP